MQSRVHAFLMHPPAARRRFAPFECFMQKCALCSF